MANETKNLWIFFTPTIFAFGDAGYATNQIPAIVQPDTQIVDQNGYDILNNELRIKDVTISLGAPFPKGLSFISTRNNANIDDNLQGVINSDLGESPEFDGVNLDETGANYSVNALGETESFPLQSNSNYPFSMFFGPGEKNGTLTFDSSSKLYTYVRRDGMVMKFSQALADTQIPTDPDWSLAMYGVTPATRGRITSITFPTGEQVNYNYKSVTIGPGAVAARIQSVTNNLGYQIHFTYELNSVAYKDYPNLIKWLNLTSVQALNNSYEYCDPLADSCNLSTGWPLAKFIRPSDGSLIRNSIDANGSVTEFGYARQYANIVNFLTSVKKPMSIAVDTLFTPAPDGIHVQKIKNSDGEWNYSKVGGTSADCINSGANFCLGTLVTDPSGATSLYTYNVIFSPSGTDRLHLLASKRDELGRISRITWKYIPYTSTLLRWVVDKTVDAEGIQHKYSYDSRGNITEDRLIAKSGSGLADRVTSATYAGNCDNIIVCNKPLNFIDQKGNVTSFSYDSAHGSVVSEVGPSVNGISHVKRSSYIQRTAWILNSTSSAYIAAGQPVWLLSEERICRNTATINGACSGGSTDEVVTKYDYGPDGVANNLSLRSKTITSENISIRHCYNYDKFGNPISQTEPRAALSSCP